MIELMNCLAATVFGVLVAKKVARETTDDSQGIWVSRTPNIFSFGQLRGVEGELTPDN